MHKIIIIVVVVVMIAAPKEGSKRDIQRGEKGRVTEIQDTQREVLLLLMLFMHLVRRRKIQQREIAARYCHCK